MNEIRASAINACKLSNRRINIRDVRLPNKPLRQEGRNNEAKNIEQNSRNGLMSSQDESSFSLIGN